jgi:MFS family permease
MRCGRSASSVGSNWLNFARVPTPGALWARGAARIYGFADSQALFERAKLYRIGGTVGGEDDVVVTAGDAERPEGPRRGHEKMQPVQLVATVATVIGLCIVGDSLLYSILPLQAQALGLSLPQVGLLLSANRLVRLGSNAWISGLFERWSPRWLFIAACLLGLFSTTIYGLGWGFAIFLIARLAWGVAWSAFRQGGYHAVWNGDMQVKGRLTGLLWGIVRLGSACAVLAGGWLYDHYGYSTTIGVMVVVTALALPVAWTIRWPVNLTPRPVPDPKSKVRRGELRDWLSALELPERRWLTAATCLQLLSSGVILSTTALFLKNLQQNTGSPLIFGLGIATMTGVLQGVRWLSDLTVGPTIGHLSDRYGQPNTATFLVCVSFCAIVGLAVLPTLLAVLCLVVIFLCDAGISTVLSASASGAAVHAPRPNLFIGVFATAGDAGSALGPLLALSIGNVLGLPLLYLILSAALLMAVWRYRGAVNGERVG